MKSIVVLVVGIAASAASAQVVRFEGFAPPGGLINVNPSAPYSEAGFTFTPSNGSSAVFDANAAADMPGNSASSWFGWAEGNTITVTRAGFVFSLSSALVGPSTAASGPASVTITGYLIGGGTSAVTYPNLTTATLVNPNFTNVTRVDFTTSDDAGMDNVAFGPAAGTNIVFEGFAPPGGLVNVSPAAPYNEAGFRFTPSNSNSAVFDAAASTDMPGNSNSSFLGWAEGNIITMTRASGATFFLGSAVIGPSTLASGPSSVTITGHTAGGPVQQVFPGLTGATIATLNWANLTSVEFTSSDDAAVDNIVAFTAPCYANCDGSTIVPVLNVNDFTCFLNKYAANDPYANCDGSTIPPILNVNDFTCFINKYAAGCP